MKNQRTVLWILCLLWIFAPVTGATEGKENPPPLLVQQEQAPTLASLKQQLSELVAQEGLSEEQRNRRSELLEQAIDATQQYQQLGQEITRIRSQVEQAATRTREIRQRLDRPQAEIVLPQELMTLDALSAQSSREEAQLTQLQENQERYRKQLQKLHEHTSSGADAMITLRETLRQIQQDLALPAVEGEEAQLTAIRRAALLSRQQLRKQMLELQQLYLDHRESLSGWINSELDLLNREHKAQSQLLDQLRVELNRLREALALEQQRHAEEERVNALGLPAPIRTIAEENVVLSEELGRITQLEGELSHRLQESKRKHDWVSREISETRRRVEFVGDSEAIGRMLKRRRSELPSFENHRRRMAERVREINRATNRMVDLEESKRDLLNVDSTIEGLMLRSSEEIRQRLEGIEYYRELMEQQYRIKARQLLNDQREQLSKLSQRYSAYVSRLTEFDLAEQQLVTESGKFASYIDEHLIWIANLQPIALQDGVAMLQVLEQWLTQFTLQNFDDAAAALSGSNPLRLLLFLPLLLLLLNRSRLQYRLQRITTTPRGVRDDSILYTFQALLYTLLLSAAVPLLLYLLAWWVRNDVLSSTIALHYSAPLTAVAGLLLLLNFFQQACAAQGVGRRNLHWSSVFCEHLLQQLRWAKWSAAVLLFVVLLSAQGSDEGVLRGVGRPALLLLLLVAALFILRLVGRGGKHLLASKGEVNSFEYRWLLLLSGAFALIAIGSLVGYHHTALLVGENLYITLVFLLMVLLFRDVVMRFLQLSDRRLRYEEALKRREELRAQRERTAEEGEKLEPLPEIEQESVDVQELGEQAKRLLMTSLYLTVAVGLWLIWEALLPAFGMLEGVTIPFTTTELVDGIEKIRAITLLDLVKGGLLVLITVVLTKNLPGLMEIILLQRLPLDTGSRYAIRTLTQYGIAAIGIIAIFNAIGVNWSSVQWLVAALSVGLGFGLQEIVANFVSGIILLFERPIRVGDTVTVGDVSGTVVRIRIRATTIRAWDRQELIVPNKEFITTQLLNWTLGDQVNRIIISVGVAYGSDVDRAHALMLEAAAELSSVLEDPEPTVSFEEFGDNALLLRIRCYIGSMDQRLSSVTEMHRLINHKFNQAGISMAFPQRDLHLNTSTPLNIRLHTAER